MKVLYLTVPSFFDLEISLIRELEKVCDISVILFVSPQSMHSSAFDINQLPANATIIKASKFEEMNKYKGLINLEKWLVANNPDNSVLSSITLTRQIKRIIKEEKYDIIHSSTECKSSLFLAPTIKKFKNTLYTLHDPFPHKRISKFRKWFSYDLMFFCYKNLLLLSDSLAPMFKEKYRNKYHKLYYSDLSIYDFLLSYDKHPNKYGKYILFFGRIDEYKGVDLLLKAFPCSDASKQDIKLVVAGKVASYYDIDFKQDDNIIYLNKYISNEELANLINHSMFVVLPYKTATQSGCVFSAFAFNKPILATRVGDLPLKINNKVGYIIEPNDVSAIISGINIMLKSDLQEKSDNIRDRYSDGGELGWSKIAQNLVDTYREIMEG